jgi:polyisoprenoid-binding protein YceI
MALERWEIDSGHSGIHFSVRHMMLTRVRGTFSRWSGSLVAEDGDLRHASIRILIDASSIETGLAERDAHLKSADFLDTANFLELTFEGRVCEKHRAKGLRILGELSAIGRKHELRFDVVPTGRTKDPWGHERAGFTAKGSLHREALGLTWNQALGAGGFLIGDRVDFEIDVEAVLQEAAVDSQLTALPSGQTKPRPVARNGSEAKPPSTSGRRI